MSDDLRIKVPDNCAQCAASEFHRRMDAGNAHDVLCGLNGRKVRGYVEFCSEMGTPPYWCPLRRLEAVEGLEAEVERMSAELPDDYQDSKDWRSLPPVDRIRLLKEWHRDAKDGERMAWEAAAHHKDALDVAVGLLREVATMLDTDGDETPWDERVAWIERVEGDISAFLAKHGNTDGE